MKYPVNTLKWGIEARNELDAYWKGENNLLKKRSEGTSKYKQAPKNMPIMLINPNQVFSVIVFLSNRVGVRAKRIKKIKNASEYANRPIWA